MTGLSLASSGLVRAGHVHGLFPFSAGRMVTDGAARSGRRTPEPHVWPAAPLQFMRGDGWRGAAMADKEECWANAGWLLPEAQRQWQFQLENARRHMTQLDEWNQAGGLRSHLHSDLLRTANEIDGCIKKIWTVLVERLSNQHWYAKGRRSSLGAPLEIIPVQYWRYAKTDGPKGWFRSELLFQGERWFDVVVFPYPYCPEPQKAYDSPVNAKLLNGGLNYQVSYGVRFNGCIDAATASFSASANGQEDIGLVSKAPEAVSVKGLLREWTDEKLIEAAVDEDERRFKNNEAPMDQDSRFDFLQKKRDKLTRNYLKTVLMPEIRKLAEERGVQLRGRGDSKK